MSVFESVKDAIVQGRSQMSKLGQRSLAIDGLEDALIKLLDKLHVNGFGSPSSAAFQHSKKVRNLFIKTHSA